jgi:hypothetical protein
MEEGCVQSSSRKIGFLILIYCIDLIIVTNRKIYKYKIYSICKRSKMKIDKILNGIVGLSLAGMMLIGIGRCSGVLKEEPPRYIHGIVTKEIYKDPNYLLQIQTKDRGLYSVQIKEFPFDPPLEALSLAIEEGTEVKIPYRSLSYKFRKGSKVIGLFTDDVIPVQD